MTTSPANAPMMKTAKPLHLKRSRLFRRASGALLVTVLLLLGLAPVRAAQLPQQDLALAYRVYVFGLPTWFDATVHLKFSGERVVMTSELNNWIFSNSHQTEFSLADCRYRPRGYRNHGFSPGWRFDDTLQYDWENSVARYRGSLQRPGETEATYQELEYSLGEPESYGQYVDKLSQFFVIGCHFGEQNGDSPLLLNYLDDTLGRYRVNRVSGDKTITVENSAYDTIQLQSEPYDATPGSIHQRVSYWLAPELGYFPLQVKTKLGRLPLTVRLTGFSTATD